MTRPYATLAVVAAAFVTTPAARLPGQSPDAARHDTTAVALDYTYTHFDDALDPWQQLAVSLSRRTTRGSVIARVNAARRFATSGSQLEVDAYPRLGRGTYAYLNAGYSAAAIFPEWRFGGEVYRSLPRAWEASLGLRHLRFDTPVTLYTASVGRYYGNWWTSLRPFVRFADGGVAASAGVITRRYLADAQNYVGARAAFGRTPGEEGDPLAVARRSSFSVGLHGQHALRERTLGTWALSHEREEVAAGAERRRWEASVGVKRMFQGR